jgi:hypothetical protein
MLYREIISINLQVLRLILLHMITSSNFNIWAKMCVICYVQYNTAHVFVCVLQ